VTRSRQAVLAIAVTAVLTSIPPSARFDGRGTETMLAPVAAVAGPASESGDPHIRGFLTPDGQIDSEAIASSDYEGPISFAGLDARLSGDSNGALSLLPAGDLRRSNDQWCPGFGQPPGGNGLDNVVHALAIYKNRLIAGGDFLTASGVWLNHIAQWTGEEWIAKAISTPVDRSSGQAYSSPYPTWACGTAMSGKASGSDLAARSGRLSGRAG
jgi:hypothetical protein